MKTKWRVAELVQVSGKTVAHVLLQLGLREATFQRWREQNGNMETDEARRP